MAETARIVKGAHGQVIGTFIAGDEQRVAIQLQDQQRFLESRVKVCEPGQIGGMLAVSIDHQMGEPLGFHALAHGGNTVQEFFGRRGRGRLRRGAEIGKGNGFDLRGQFHARFLHRLRRKQKPRRCWQRRG